MTNSLLKFYRFPIKRLRFNYFKLRANLWNIRSKYYRIWISPVEENEIFSSTNCFFILGSGRSGTQMLSGLLNGGNEVSVYHEPDHHEDALAMDLSHKNHEYSVIYMKTFRRLSICKRIKDKKSKNYGEVTGMLRYQAKAIKETIPNAKLFVLVRDGRDVVRSVMGRFPHYRGGAKGAYNIIPKKDDQYYQQWNYMSRFEKVCWAWMDSYRYLLNQIPANRIVHFEEILSDYSYFKSKIVDPIGLEIAQDKWNDSIIHKSDNSTKTHNFPHWKKWDKKYIKSFNDICGEVMKELGYF